MVIPALARYFRDAAQHQTCKMDLGTSLKAEAARILPSVKSTMIFTVSLRAANSILDNRFESGFYMVLNTLSLILILLAIQLKCQKCIPTAKDTWWSPALEALATVLDAASQIAVAFCGTLLAGMISEVLVSAAAPAWAAWWASLGIVLASVAIKLIT